MKLKAIMVVAVLLVLPLVAGAQVNEKREKTRQKKSDIQQVTLSANGADYIVKPASVKKDVPVKMTVDLKTVKGCLTTVVISAFNVKKTVTEGDNTIEFTPDKAGKIDVVCGMNMGKGSFTVVNESNSDAQRK